MNYRFVNEATSIVVSYDAWSLILELAFMFGWYAVGTTPSPASDPEVELGQSSTTEWRGSYFVPAQQIVTSDEAIRLAAALARALDDIADYDVTPSLVVTGEADLLREPAWLGTGNPLEVFSGKNKPYLQEFIRFARQGAFTINAWENPGMSYPNNLQAPIDTHL